MQMPIVITVGLQGPPGPRGPSGAMGPIFGGTLSHTLLTDLSYSTSGHTGFESQTNAQFVSSSLVQRVVNADAATNANLQFVSGNLVTRIINSTGSLTQDHAGLTNLAYASSGHTGFESQANAQFVSSSLVQRTINSTGSLTRDHAGLTNLGYTESSHTGFAGLNVVNVFTAGQQITGDVQVTGSLYLAGDLSATRLQMTSGAHDGYVLTADGLGRARWTPSGSGGGAGVIVDHSALNQLDYASAGHTEFAGTQISNAFTNGQSIAGGLQVTGSLHVVDTQNSTFVGGGRVGVGVALPSHTLEVVGDIKDSTTSDTPGGGGIYLGEAGISRWDLRDTTTGDHLALDYNVVGTGWSTALTVLGQTATGDDGNVGIGTTAPAERLHVVGETKLQGNTSITGSLAVSTTVDARTGLLFNGQNINTSGVLSNVAYRARDNQFQTGQVVTGSLMITSASTDGSRLYFESAGGTTWAQNNSGGIYRLFKGEGVNPVLAADGTHISMLKGPRYDEFNAGLDIGANVIVTGSVYASLGFIGDGSRLTNTGFETQANAQFVSSSLVQRMVDADTALNNNLQFVSGNLVTRIVNITGSLTRDHAGLTNLAYASSAHTGFAGTGVVNTFTSGQRITGDLQVTGSVRASGSIVAAQMTIGDSTVTQNSTIYTRNGSLTVAGDITQYTTFVHDTTDNSILSTTLGKGLRLGTTDSAPLKLLTANTVRATISELGVFDLGPATTTALTVSGSLSTIGSSTVNGSLSTTHFQMTSGSHAGYVLVSDSGGNASWVASGSGGGGGGTLDHSALNNLDYSTSGHTGFESQANAQFVSGNLVTRIVNITGSLTRDHAGLTNLAYTSSGHTGFESQTNAQFVSGNLVTRIVNITGSLTQDHAGLTHLAYATSGHTGFESQANAQFVSGNLVTTIVNSTGSLTRDHAGLTNLAYASSAHTGFAGTGVVNAFSAGQRITGDVQVTGSVRVNGSAVVNDVLQLGLTPTTGAHDVGKFYWDSTWKTGGLNLEGDSTLQLGQETLAYVYNGTGIPLLNGQAVYISGSFAGVPNVALAIATSYETSFVLGLVTSTTISAGAYGYVCIRGHVNDFDTSGLTVGSSVYLSPTVLGGLTTTAPSSGQYDVRIGRVMLSDISNGRIYVNVRPESRLTDLSDVTVTTPVLDEVLRYNGVEWVNGSPVAVSASPGIVFYNSSPTILTGSVQNTNTVNSLTKAPVTTAQQLSAITCSVGGTTYQGAAWLYNTDLGRTTIDSGIWAFATYAAVSSVAGGRVTTLTRQIYQVVSASVVVSASGTGPTRTVTSSVGAPFPTSCVVPSATNTVASFLQTPKGLYQIEARASSTSITIDVPAGYTNESNVPVRVWYKLFSSTSPAIITTGTTYGLYVHESTQPAFTMALTDRLGGIMFGTSTAATNIAVVYDGTNYNTHVSTPLITLHNNLAGLQGGASNEDYHLTSAEYTGTGSGVFTRQTGPTLTSPTVSGTLQITGSIQATSAFRVGPGADALATMYVSGSSSQGILEIDDWRGREVMEIRSSGASVFRENMQITGSLYVSGGLYGGGAVQSSLATNVGPTGSIVNLAYAYASTSDYEGTVLSAVSGSTDVGGWLVKNSGSAFTVYANSVGSSVFWIVVRKTQ